MVQHIGGKKSVPVVLLIIAGATAVGLMWTGESSFDERIITVRYLLFGLAAFISFSTPYLLFPDENTPMLQLGNVRGSNFTRYLFDKVMGFYWPVFLLIAVMLFGDIENPGQNLLLKSVYFVAYTSILVGLLLISVRRYVMSGPDSQFWKESDRGRELRVQAADYFKFPLDPGSIPSLVNTIVILLIGSLSVIVSASAGNAFGREYELAVGILLLIWGLFTAYRFRKKWEYSFYSSNAFFREFFRANLKGEELEARREVNQLWWVPGALKAHVWQYLVQLDRKIPSGRIVAGGHALIWFMAYQRPDPGFLIILWSLFAILHHLLIIMTFKNEISPPWLLNWMGSNNTWLFARFWMQFRWVLPLLISMNLQLFIFGVPDLTGQIFVLSAFLIAGLGVSAIGRLKLKNEFKNR